MKDGNGRMRSDAGGPLPRTGTMRSSARDMAHDVATLIELQSNLLAIDAKRAWRRMVVPAVLGIVAVGLLIGSVPVLVLGVARYVAAASVMGEAAALVVTSLVAICISAGLVGAGALLLRTAFGMFERSRDELVRNISLLKEVLKKHRGRETPPRGERPDDF